MKLEHKVLSPEEHHCDLPSERNEGLSNQEDATYQAIGQTLKCCGKNGICTHEILRDGEADSDCESVKNGKKKKASFKLAWYCKGENSDQYKHDVVSFARGNITTA
ncbi:hypothetical protein Nepgr_024084 [Nepenthes gracilis]|uniref:Uncharacterized protein n=1 Tax=Nepenthes gracilis TaxID=150966 RepID=A0AAD3T413_NEPGR|nr:hypothetical protein Nepgr_024084 [Nepenthes gracilis]